MEQAASGGSAAPVLGRVAGGLSSWGFWDRNVSLGGTLCQVTSEVLSSLHLSCALHTLTPCGWHHPTVGQLGPIFGSSWFFLPEAAARLGEAQPPPWASLGFSSDPLARP